MHEAQETIARNVPVEFFSSTTARPTLTVICHGGCGANVALAMISEMNPDDHPHMHFLVLESNGHVLLDHFSRAKISQLQKSEHPDMSMKWFKKHQVSIIQLGEEGSGAGGDPKRGEELLNQSLDKIREVLGTPRAVVLVGGGGGGTASGTMPGMARLLRDRAIPTYAILAIPRIKEGIAKMRKAQQVLSALLEICPTLPVYNERIPNKNISLSKVYSEINLAGIIPVLGILRSFILKPGNVQGVDTSDWSNALKVGNYTLLGFFETSAGLDGYKQALLGNPYLDTRVIRNSLTVLFWLDGEWTVADIDEVSGYVIEQMQHSNGNAEVEIKYGVQEEGVEPGYRSIAFVAFAKDGPDEIEEKPVFRGPIQAALPAPDPISLVGEVEFVPEVVAVSPNGNGNHSIHKVGDGMPEVPSELKTVGIHFMVHDPDSGEEVQHRDVLVTPELAREFNAFFRKGLSFFDRPLADELKAKVWAQTKLTPIINVPTLAGRDQRPAMEVHVPIAV